MVLGLSVRLAARRALLVVTAVGLLAGTSLSDFAAAQGPVDLQISVQFQGSGRPEPQGWQRPATVQLFSLGADVLSSTPLQTVSTTTAFQTSTRTAVFTVPGVALGTYDVTIQSPGTLLSVRRGVTVAEGAPTLDMGTLLAGDANDDGLINVSDFGILALSYLKQSGQVGFDSRADFDANGRVNIADFGLLAVNFLRSSPKAVSFPSAIDLLASSDRGPSDTDNVTNDTTPTLSVTAASGTVVRLFVDNQLVGQATVPESGLVQFTTAVLADRAHLFTAELEDGVGNVETTEPLQAIIDSAAPVLTVTRPSTGEVVRPGSRLIGTMDGTGSAPTLLVYRFDALTEVPVLVNKDTGSFVQDLVITGLAAGQHTLEVTATDLAGNAIVTTLNPQVDPIPLLTLDARTPLHGAVDVGVTFKPQLFFSRPVDPFSLNDTNFFATFGGEKLAATIVPSNEGLFAWLFFAEAMPDATQVKVTVDGSTILPGDGGTPLDADGDGTPGGVLTYAFTTVSSVPVPETSLSGVVVDAGPDGEPHTADDVDLGPDGLLHTADDVFLLPIQGVELHIIGLEGNVVTTGADGTFSLTSTPVGDVKLVLDGMTATSPPTSFYFPEMVIDVVDVQPGVDNFAMMGMPALYLPRLPTAILKDVTVTGTTLIVADAISAPDLPPEQRSLLSVEIQPDSLVSPTGEKLASGQVGISTVAPELVQDMLPPGVLQHTFDITVQAPGISNFSEPAPMTFPNVFDAPAGSQLNFLSFDHTTGRLVIEGTMTVSADGLSVSTDPDTGVTHPGWHGMTPRGTQTEPPCDPTVTHDTEKEPVVLSLMPSGRFYTNDEGEFDISVKNIASGVTFVGEGPCGPINERATELHVFVDVFGPADQFLEGPVAGADAMVLPQMEALFKYRVKDLLGFEKMKKINEDQLYGAKFRVQVFSSEPVKLESESTFFIYRFLDAADAAHAFSNDPAHNDAHADGIVEMPDMRADAGFNALQTRHVNFQTGGFAPTIVLDDAPGFFFDNSSRDFVFFPQVVQEELSTNVRVLDPNGFDVTACEGCPKLRIKGQGTPTNKIFVNKDELSSVLRLLANFAEDLPEVSTALLTQEERALFDTPEESDAIANDVEVEIFRRFIDLQGFGESGPGVELTASPDESTITVVWTLRSATTPTLGESRPFPTDDGVDNWNRIEDVYAGRSNFSETVNFFRLSEALNQSFKTNVAVHVDNVLEWSQTGEPLSLTRPQLVNVLAWVAAHEIGHTLGLVHARNDGFDILVSEVQLLTLVGGDNSSTFTLSFGGATTDALPRNATSDEVKTALEALATVTTAANLTVDFAGSNYTVEFGSSNFDILAGIDVPPMTGAGTNGLSVSVETIVDGQSKSVTIGNKEVVIKGVAGADDIRGRDDIMGGSALDLGGKKRFLSGITRELLRMGLHSGWDQAEARKAFSFLARHITKSITAGTGGDPDSHVIGFTGPRLAIFGPRDELIFQTFDVATATVDGAGGALNSTPLTLVNFGSQDLVLNSVELVDPAGNFAMAPLAAGTTLPAGSSTVLAVTFDPLTSGTLTSTLLLDTNDPTAQTELPLTGFGLSPFGDIRVDVPLNNVGGLSITGTPLTVTDFATIQNIGASPLTVTDVVISSGVHQYEIAGLPAGFGPGSPLVLAPGETSTFSVIFDPNETGLLPGEIQVLSDDPETPDIRRSIIGTGLAASGTALAYGNDFVAMETPFLADSPVLRQISDRDGNWTFFLPQEETIHHVIFDPASGLVAHGWGVSAPSGQPTLISAPVFLASVAPDTDGDGLPDDAEFATGTSATNADTDGDGLTDFVEVGAGLDPFGGRAFPTGVIASLDLPGNDAREVVVEAFLGDVAERIAYVAAGSEGLALVDVSQFDSPVLLGQLALPGVVNDVAVDVSGKIAVLTAGPEGLHVVDISDPRSPLLLRTVVLPHGARRVEVLDGLAYVASGPSLGPLPAGVISIVLRTGEVAQALDVGGNNVFDLAREGATLYAVDLATATLRVIDLSGFEMVARGSLALPNGFGHLFVGNGIAYVVSQLSMGYQTVDVSDPDNLVLISGRDVPDGTLTGSQGIVVNGSGLGLLFGRGVDLLDVSDPSQTFVLRTQFTLPEGGGDSVSLASGIAFVAEGGLHVLNYLTFDNQGQEPAVTISSPAPDADPAAAGVQVVEGSSIPIRVEVTDDVQVRSVDLLVNGDLAARDISFPFDFVATAARSDPASPAMAVQVRATDTGANQGLSNVLAFEVFPDTVAPAIEQMSPAAGAESGRGLRTVRMRFSEPLAAGSVTTANFELRDFTDSAVAAQAIESLQRGRTVRLTYAPLPTGSYSLVIKASQVTDLAGNAMGLTDEVVPFELLEATIQWIGGDGDWTEPANWDKGRLPGLTDAVLIDVPGDVTVTLSSALASVRSLRSLETLVIGSVGTLALGADSEAKDFTLGSGGTLTGSGDLTVTGQLDWTGGNMSGTGATHIADTATLIIGGFSHGLNRTLTNAGTTTWTGGRIGSGKGAVFNNLAGATFDAQASAAFGLPKAKGTFNNAGTFTKSGGAGSTASFHVVFNNTGTVHAQTGTTLRLIGGGASTGNFDLAQDARLEFGGFESDLGTYYLRAGTAITGAGFAEVAFFGSVSLAADVTAENFAIEGGTLTGTGDLTVSGALVWNGRMSGSGTTNVQATATLDISGSGTKRSRGRTINNAGTATWTGGNIFIGQGTVFNNLPGATFDVQNSEFFDVISAVTGPQFNNAGTFTKSAGAGTTMRIPFNNTGTVNVQTSTLDLTSGGTSSGAFTVAAGARIEFRIGTHTLEAGATFSGDGVIAVTGGTLSLSSAVTAERFELSVNGTLGGAGDLSVSSELVWTNGTMEGTGTTTVASTALLTMGGIGGRTLLGRTLTNAGTATWTGGTILIGQGAVFNNLAGATFDVQTDRVFDQIGTGEEPQFNNAGAFTKSAGAASTMDVAFNNTGTVTVQTSTLKLTRGGTSSGAFTAASGARIEFGGLPGAHTLDPGVTMTGAGVTAITAGGTVTLSSTAVGVDAVTAENFELSGGTLSGAGDLEVSGELVWLAGTMEGTGTTIISSTASLTIGTSGTTLRNRTITNAGTATWTGGRIVSGQGAVFNNLAGATFDAQSDRAFDITLGGTVTVFNNAGTFTKSAGAATTMDVAFNNTGTVTVQTSTLKLTRGGTSNGAFTAALDTRIEFRGFTDAHTLDPGATLAGAGVIAVAGAVTLSSTAVGVDAVTAERFELSGGRLGGGGDLRVSSELTWTSGTMEGTGTTTVSSAALLTIGSTSSKTLRGRTLTNAGTATWTGGTINSGQGAAFNNLASATFDAQAARAFGFTLGGTVTQFNNAGTVTKTAGAATTMDVAFNNTGTVTVQTSTLKLTRGGTSNGAFTAALDARIEFRGFTDTHTLDPGATLAGAGVIAVAGVVTLSSTAVGVDAVTAERFELSGGRLGGGGDLRVSSELTWTSGTMEGTGTTIVSAPAILTISGTGSKEFLSRSIDNAGTATWTGGTINNGQGAVFNNLASATFDVQTDRTFDFIRGGTVTVFNNAGTFTKTAGAATTMDVAFNNTGTVTVLTSTLKLTRGGTSSGTFSAALGARIEFGGLAADAHTLDLGTTLAGDGVIAVTAGVVTLSSAAVGVDAVTAENLELSGSGKLSGAGDLNVTGLFNWISGTMEGTGTTIISSTAALTISGTSNKEFLSRSIDNAGTATWTGGTINNGQGAVFNNLAGATFDAQAGRTFDFIRGGTVTVFNNAGTFTKTAGAATTMDVAFNNTGTVTVLTSTLKLTRGGTSSGTFSAALGARIEFGGLAADAHTLDLGTTLAGDGVIAVTAGVVTLSSAAVGVDAVTAENLELSGSGKLSGAGDLNVTGLFNWIRGTMEGTGTTTISSTAALTISGTSSKTLRSRTIDNAGTATWTGGNILSGQGAVFNNLASATFDVQVDATFDFTLGGTVTVFNNAGTFVKTAGNGTTIIDVDFNNTGTVEAQIGTLAFTRGFTGPPPL